MLIRNPDLRRTFFGSVSSRQYVCFRDRTEIMHDVSKLAKYIPGNRSLDTVGILDPVSISSGIRFELDTVGWVDISGWVKYPNPTHHIQLEYR